MKNHCPQQLLQRRLHDKEMCDLGSGGIDVFPSHLRREVDVPVPTPTLPNASKKQFFHFFRPPPPPILKNINDKWPSPPIVNANWKCNNRKEHKHGNTSAQCSDGFFNGPILCRWLGTFWQFRSPPSEVVQTSYFIGSESNRLLFDPATHIDFSTSTSNSKKKTAQDAENLIRSSETRSGNQLPNTELTRVQTIGLKVNETTSKPKTRSGTAFGLNERKILVVKNTASVLDNCVLHFVFWQFSSSICLRLAVFCFAKIDFVW